MISDRVQDETWEIISKADSRVSRASEILLQQ